MVEKFKGVLPPGSVWYKLNKDETVELLKHRGELEKMRPYEIADLDSSEIQALPGQSKEVEDLLKEVGLKIVTLFD